MVSCWVKVPVDGSARVHGCSLVSFLRDLGWKSLGMQSIGLGLNDRMHILLFWVERLLFVWTLLLAFDIRSKAAEELLQRKESFESCMFFFRN